MKFCYKGIYVNNAKELLTHYRNGWINVRYPKNDILKIFLELPNLITQDDIDQYCYAFFIYRHARSNDDYLSSLKITQKLMKKEFVPSYFLYACMLLDGKIITKNHIGFVMYLNKIIELIPDFAPALYNLGYCYYKGIGVKVDVEKGVELIEKAKSLDYDNAINFIGQSYLNGKVYKQDFKKAFECFSIAASRENEYSCHKLGFLYSKGLGCPQDNKKSLEYFHLSAEKGYVEAQYMLGLIYSIGNITKKNIPLSLHYFIKAARQGHTKAMGYAGSILLSQKDGVYGRAAEGIDWIKKGAKLGDELCISLAKENKIRY